MTILNGVIEKTFLGIEDHGIFTMIILIKMGIGNQGFGFFALDDSPEETRSERKPTKYGMACIMEVLNVIGVNSWEELQGKSVRVERKEGNITKIGNYLEDKWFDKDATFEEYKEPDKESD